MTLIYAILSAIFAAAVSIFAKIGLKNVDSSLATTIRSVIMSIFLVGFVLITNKVKTEDFAKLETKDWIFIALSAIAGAVSWLFYFSALQSSDSASRIAAIDKLSIVFVFIFSLFFLQEKFEWSNLFGIVLIALGGIIFVLK